MSPRSSRGYDGLARWYQPLEYVLFGNSLAKARVAGLDWLEANVTPQRVLVLGDGDGRLLEQLVLKFPEVTITSVDFSARMLRRQQSRLARGGHSHRVTWIHADALRWTPEQGAYDVVVFAFFLDAFSPSELDEHLTRWLGALRAGGVVYYVDFVASERVQGSMARMVARSRLVLMHQLFRIVTKLPNHQLPAIRERIEAACPQVDHEHRVASGTIEVVVFRK